MKITGLLFCSLGVFLTLLAGPVFPLSYEIDFNGDGSYDGAWDMSVGDSIRVAIWLDDYTCLPDDKLFGTQLYVQFDSNKLQTVEAFSNDVRHGGPFDVGFSGFIERKPGIYNLTAAHFDYVRVDGDRILIGTIILEATSSGNTTIKAVNKLGIEGFDDGFVSDCELKQLFPDDAVATINLTGGSGDDDDDGGDGDRGSEGEERDDSGGEAIPSNASEGSSVGPGMVSNDSDGARTLSNRPVTSIPELFAEESFDSEEERGTRTRTGEASSPRRRQASSAAGPSEEQPRIASQTTTSVKRPASPYQVLIIPSSLTVDGGGLSQLSAKTLFQGKEIEGTYDWKIVPASSIGSKIDKNGQFVAGINATGFDVEETIRVTDTKNGTDAETVFTVNPQLEESVECQLTVNPSLVTLYPGDTVAFSGRSSGKKCKEGVYKWRVNTRIGSEISSEGIYSAGNKSIGKETIDIIILEDDANGITAQSLVTVLLPQEVSGQAVESMQQPDKGTAVGKGMFPGIFFIVLICVSAVVAGLVLYIKNRR